MLLAAKGLDQGRDATGSARLLAPADDDEGHRSLMTEARGLLPLRSYCIFGRLSRTGQRTPLGSARTTADDPQTAADEDGTLVLEARLTAAAASAVRYVEVEDCTTDALVLANSMPLRAR